MSANIFLIFSNFLNKIFFFEIYGFPFLVVCLMFTGIFLSFKLGFPNFRMFKHGVKVGFLGKYNNKEDKGEITSQQSLFTAISGTVGLGNIAGVAIGVTLGGPGSIFWMIVNAFFGMNSIFTETTLSQTYREIGVDGRVVGGPFRYLKYGLADIGFKKLGIFLSVFYSILFIMGGIGASMFQANQAIVSLLDFSVFMNMKIYFALVIAGLSFYMLISGTKTIGNVLGKFVPIMASIYVLSILTILFFSFREIPDAILIILKDAFGIQPVVGGFIGSLAMGVKRSGYSSEAGMGTTSIAHSVAKTNEPIRQACVACLTPFIDTILFCSMTGLAIVSTGVYRNTNFEGVLMTKQAFLTVSDWFSVLLSVIVVLFALSTVIAYSFSGQLAWKGFFKNKYVFVFNTIFPIALFTSAFINLETVLQISDTFFLSSAIPNIIGILLLSGLVKKKLNEYIKKLNNGEFDKTKNSDKNNSNSNR